MKNLVNEERLTTLAKFLVEKVPMNHFNLNSWFSRTSLTEAELVAHKCGTTACAVGWACTIPEFKDQGLYMHQSTGQPVYKGMTSWDAAEGFFGLIYGETIALFSSESYMEEDANPDGVAHRIKMFLENPQAALDMAEEASQYHRVCGDL